jgi:hypothetical protein
MNEFEEICHSGGSLKFLWDDSQGFSISYSGKSPYPVALYQLCVSMEGKILEIVPCGGIGSQIPYPQPSILVYMISDREGMFGRECPSCNTYFRVSAASSKVMTCPYCYWSHNSLEFLTKNQLKYAELYCQTYCAAINEQKTFEIDIEALTNELPENRPTWISDERQQNLYICTECKTKYDILGEYAYCPICSKNNYREVFSSKLESMKNEFTSFEELNNDRCVREAKWEELTKKCVSEFEAMANELKKFLVSIPTTKRRRNSISQLNFQSIIKTARLMEKWLDIQIIKDISQDDQNYLNKMFNRRHLFTHNSGRVDQEYLNNTKDNLKLNQTVKVRSNEIYRLLNIIEKCSTNLLDGCDAIE